MIDNRQLGCDLQVACRTGRHTGALEYVQRQGGSLENRFGAHLDAVPNPDAIIIGNRARPEAHPPERNMIRLLFS